MFIREIQQKDDAALFQLVRQSLAAAQLNIPGTAYFDESIKAMSQFYLNHPQRKYFVLVNQDDEVLGGAGFAEYNGSQDVAEVQKLYLFDEAKGKGYSYKLMEQVELEAKKAGYKQLYLETHRNLPIAIILYKKLGYTLIPEALPGTVHSTMDHFFIKDL
ncbi:MAG: GNAT family N-acetyltransferase [Treponema sp.]|nr:GNAT family N-acetyltransferase [Treponema sp.]